MAKTSGKLADSHATSAAHLAGVRQALRPAQLFPNVTAGLIGGLLGVILGLSYATLVFSGSLQSHLAVGLGLGLFGAIVLNLAAARGSTLPIALASPQEAAAVILAVMASSTAGSLAATAPERVMPTVLAVIAITSVATGVFFLALGFFHLGRLVRFVPFPVIGGFLAGTGWLMSIGALQVLTGDSVTRASAHLLGRGADLGHAAPGILVAAALLGVMKRFKHYLVMPALLLAGVCVFYLVLALTSMSPAHAQHDGWFLGPFPPGGLYHPLGLSGLSDVDWSVVAGQAGNMIAVMVICAVALLLNVTGLEVAIDTDLDVDRELRALGFGNVAAGLGGGLTGFHTITSSLVAGKIGATSRLVGVVAAGVAALILFGGTAALAYIPRAVLGGLLLYMGLDLLYEWVVLGLLRMPRLDFAMVFLMLVVVSTWGFLQALVVGIVLSVLLFVITYSRTGAIKYELDGRAYRSSVDRSLQQQEALQELGDRLYILTLQGFLFFGTATTVLDRIRARVESQTDSPIGFVVMDLRLVTGADASTVLTFAKLRQLAQREQFRVVLTGVTPPIAPALQLTGSTGTRAHGFTILADLDRGVEWCEDQILDAAGARWEHRPLLQQLELELGTAELASHLMRVLDRVELEEGQHAVRQGAPSDALYLVESGKLSVLLERADGPAVRLRTIAAGAVLGEMGFYLGTPRSASVVAMEHTVLYRLTRFALDDLQRSDPGAAVAFADFMARLQAARVIGANQTVAALMR